MDFILIILFLLGVVLFASTLVTGVMKALRISNDDVWFWGVLSIGVFIILVL